jgi:hypothetical protein
MGVSVQFEWEGEEAKLMVKKYGSKGVREACEVLLEDSKTECPFREGILENTGFVDYDYREGKGDVIYDSPYAARLHEHPEYNFKGKGKGKWLERSYDRLSERLLAHISKRIKEAMR